MRAVLAVVVLKAQLRRLLQGHALAHGLANLAGAAGETALRVLLLGHVFAARHEAEENACKLQVTGDLDAGDDDAAHARIVDLVREHLGDLAAHTGCDAIGALDVGRHGACPLLQRRRQRTQSPNTSTVGLFGLHFCLTAGGGVTGGAAGGGLAA